MYVVICVFCIFISLLFPRRVYLIFSPTRNNRKSGCVLRVSARYPKCGLHLENDIFVNGRTRERKTDGERFVPAIRSCNCCAHAKMSVARGNPKTTDRPIIYYVICVARYTERK